MNHQPLVTNVANEEQVKAAEKRQKLISDQQAEDLKYVMASVQGRRVLWHLLSHCAVFESIWRQSAEIHYLAGKQDVGHYLVAAMTAVSEDAFIQMMKENQGKGVKKNG